MGATATFALGGLVLLTVCALAYVRWIRPRPLARDVQAGGMLALIVLAFAGALVGAPAWWADQPGSFSWDLPPLASRMLAAAACAFVVAAVLTLEHPSRGRVRVMLLLIAVYLAPLLVAIPIAHLDRFDPSAPITYAFFGIVGVMTVASLWYLVRQPAIVEEDVGDSRQSSSASKLWLGALVVVTGLWGLALFATDDGPSGLIWVWPGDLLTSRLIAVMLLALAVGAVAAMRTADAARMMLAVALTYGIGVMLATWWATLDGRPVKEAYLIAFGLVALGSGIVLILDRLSVARPVVRRT